MASWAQNMFFHQRRSEALSKFCIDNINNHNIDVISNKPEVDQGTHHKFDGNNTNTSRIDWIMSSSEFDVNNIQILKDSKDGLYPSDHFPVLGSFTI